MLIGGGSLSAVGPRTGTDPRWDSHRSRYPPPDADPARRHQAGRRPRAARTLPGDARTPDRQSRTPPPPSSGAGTCSRTRWRVSCPCRSPAPRAADMPPTWPRPRRTAASTWSWCTAATAPSTRWSNGLMYRGVRPDIPMLAVVPGGSTNVFARAHGHRPGPDHGHRTDPRGARRPSRPHRLPRPGRRPLLHLQRRPGPGCRDGPRGREAPGHGQRDLQRDARPDDDRSSSARIAGHPRLSLELPGRDPIVDAHLVFVSNVDPWTYLGNRPVRTNPGISPTGGLGIFALTSMSVPMGLLAAGELLTRAGPGTPTRHPRR